MEKYFCYSIDNNKKHSVLGIYDKEFLSNKYGNDIFKNKYIQLGNQIVKIVNINAFTNTILYVVNNEDVEIVQEYPFKEIGTVYKTLSEIKTIEIGYDQLKKIFLLELVDRMFLGNEVKIDRLYGVYSTANKVRELFKGDIKTIALRVTFKVDNKYFDVFYDVDNVTTDIIEILKFLLLKNVELIKREDIYKKIIEYSYVIRDFKPVNNEFLKSNNIFEISIYESIKGN